MRHFGDPAPEGYSHAQQWGAPSITTSPGAVVTFDGTLDLTSAGAGEWGLIGLLDTASLAAGERGLQEGSYIYVTMLTASTVRIGLSDGRLVGGPGGEYVQNFHDVDVSDGQPVGVTFTINPNADPATCASHAADVDSAEGCLTLSIDGLEELTDSYGSITTASGANGGEEFRDGGTAGWDGPSRGAAAHSTGIVFDLNVSPVVVPLTKEDCKKGSWSDPRHGRPFKNQGACVSFYAKA